VREAWRGWMRHLKPGWPATFASGRGAAILEERWGAWRGVAWRRRALCWARPAARLAWPAPGGCCSLAVGPEELGPSRRHPLLAVEERVVGSCQCRPPAPLRLLARRAAKPGLALPALTLIKKLKSGKPALSHHLSATGTAEK